MKLTSHKDLVVWQRGMSLVKAVYEITKQLPRSEIYGLTSQMQRAAVSIPSNIAEGYERKGTAEYLRFLSIAYGSSAELETQLMIVRQQYKAIKIEETEQLLIEVQKMLYSIMAKLRAKTLSPMS